MAEVEFKSSVEASAQELFAWHSRPGAFERLVPPWDNIEVVERQGTITDGSRLKMRIKQGPIGVTWVAHHRDYIEGEQFRDEQVRGPFARWVHTHRFEPQGEQQSLLHDAIEYKLPLEPLSSTFMGWFFRDMLKRMFIFRHTRTQNDLKRHTQASSTISPMTVAISGASGMVGTQLSAFLTTGGHTVRPMVRSKGQAIPGAIPWSPSTQTLNPRDMEGLDAVVHLAGATIGRRWNARIKQQIMDSRIEGTRLLCETLAQLDHKPKVLVSASAIGYYGNRGDTVLTEESDPGEGFLAEVCKAWEHATEPAREAGIRVVNLRIGIVLTALGGALGQQLLPFKLGLGGPVGSGRQYQSWIALDDLIGAIHHALITESLEGPVNGVAPTPVPQAHMAQQIGKVLSRPAFMPLPAPAVNLIFGEMGEELLLSGARIMPNALVSSGFEYFFPDVEEALRFELGRQREAPWR
ncbi:MAG: TIGR01777 family oxidoreductase [Myxococcota bacterium]